MATYPLMATYRRCQDKVGWPLERRNHNHYRTTVLASNRMPCIGSNSVHGIDDAGDGIELGCSHCASLLEAFAAEHWASLRWPKGNRGFLSALRTTGLGFRAYRSAVAAAAGLRALGLTGLATLRLVLETLVGEKHLFAGSKYKLGATLRALQNLVMVFHGSVPP
jgi:hypothetical protein